MGCRSWKQRWRLSGILPTPPNLKMGTVRPAKGEWPAWSHTAGQWQAGQWQTQCTVNTLPTPHTGVNPRFFLLFSHFLWLLSDFPSTCLCPPVGGLLEFLPSFQVPCLSGNMQISPGLVAPPWSSVLCPKVGAAESTPSLPQTPRKYPGSSLSGQETLALGMPRRDPHVPACGTAPPRGTPRSPRAFYLHREEFEEVYDSR